MALNFQPERIDHDGLSINLGAIERHIDDDHYVRGFTPGEFVLFNSAAFITVATAAPRWPAIEMPDAVFSEAFVSFRKPSEWRTGHLRLRFWYTSDVGSTNNFGISLAVRAVRGGEVLNGTALLSAATVTYAGPAVAGTLVRSAYTYTTTALGSDDELFSVMVERNGGDAGDTNVNDFLLLYLEVTHIPAVQVSQ